MLTKAHLRSKNFVMDPAYSAEKLWPEPRKKSEFPYLYAPDDFLCACLETMRSAAKKAKLLVGYPGKYRESTKELFFVSEYAGGQGRFRCPVSATLFLNGVEVPTAFFDGVFSFDAPEGTLTAVVCGETATFQPLWHAVWGCTSDPSLPTVQAEERFPSECGDLPPHLEELPFVNLTPEKIGEDLYDAGRETFAYVTIYADDVDSFHAGETKEETLSENAKTLEQTTELTEIDSCAWRTPVPLAFRYLKIKACALKKIVLHAVFTPECYKGAFASDDAELNEIWMKSAYTLRLCHRNFLIDGVKRDRLPWSGDLRISLLSECFTFADNEVVENTLSVLGCSGVLGHINGITDYSLWYVINHDTYQLYSGRKEFLEREYPKIVTVLENLEKEEEAETGFLSQGERTFIDWFEFDKTSALQFLYVWALKAGARLASRMGDFERKKRWGSKAERLSKTVKETFWDAKKGFFYDGAERNEIHRYANFLAILSGVETDNVAMAELLTGKNVPEVGTPYMAAMEIKALSDAGYRREALDKLRKLWGAMLKDGATTFYEAYDETLPEAERHAFYNRPFGLSLCHAWGAGPAWLLPEIFFGVIPTEDGWKKFKVEPGDFLKGDAFLTVPTPQGDVELSIEGGKLSVKNPAGMERE